MTIKTTDTSSETSSTVFWCGSEESFEVYLRAKEAIIAGMANGSLDLKAFSSEQSDHATSSLLTREGNVGIITVAGPLTNEDNPFNRFFGVTSYAEIGRALQAAAADPVIKVVAMNYGTPGGAVNGVHDLATSLKVFSDTIKPLHSYTGSVMASAGLWLGASSKTISVSPTAIVGSIGILQVHTETSKMMADMGVKRTVIRVGEHKALINPHEPLTDKALASVHNMMGEIYSVFMGHVASARKTDYAKADAAYGQGREFVGKQAVDVGLASQVTSFDKFIANLQQQVDKNGGDPQNAGNHQRGRTMTLKALSQTAADAMKASGMSEEAILAIDQSTFEANQAEAKAKAEVEAKAKADAAAALAAASSGAGLGANALLEKVAAQAADLFKATTERDEAKTALGPLQVSLESCRGIIAASLNTMKVALGGSAVDHKATSIADLLKAHTETETAFKVKYPSGQVSASSSAQTEADKVTAPTWASTAAAVQASRTTKA